MDWMKLAVALPAGRSRRLDCWQCGSKNATSITNMGRKYAVHCFRCGFKEVQDPPPMTPAERLAMKQAAEAFEADEPSLPSDFTLDIPIPGVLWVSKGGLHVDHVRRLGWGWSEKHQRVIMPVYDGDKLVAVQARAVHSWMKPKYLSQMWSGPRAVFKAGDRHTGTLVLTEDMLSAARVSKVTDAWIPLGTNMMTAVVSRIAKASYDKIGVWMDDDEAGHRARRKILRKLGAVGIEANAVVSDRDPKHHTIQEIKELV